MFLQYLSLYKRQTSFSERKLERGFPQQISLWVQRWRRRVCRTVVFVTTLFYQILTETKVAFLFCVLSAIRATELGGGHLWHCWVVVLLFPVYNSRCFVCLYFSEKKSKTATLETLAWSEANDPVIRKLNFEEKRVGRIVTELWEVPSQFVMTAIALSVGWCF